VAHEDVPPLDNGPRPSLALLIGTGVLVAAAMLVKRYLPDQGSSTATAAAVAEHETGTARLEARTEHHIHALEAPETAP
jgi:hypothetical protein